MKRQQTQTQSQGGKGGNQLQSQSQDAPAGQQHQTQSQGQNLEPIATPAAHPHNDNRHEANQASLIPQGNEQQHTQGNQGNSVQQGNQGGSVPQGNQQQYAPQQEHPDTENRNQQSYPQPQPQPNYQPQANYQPGFAPFGFGAFGPQGFKLKPAVKFKNT